MTNSKVKRSTSLVLALLLMVTSVLTALPAFAEGGIIDVYEMEICYEDGETVVPDKDENGDDYIEHVMESEKLQLAYKLVGCNILACSKNIKRVYTCCCQHFYKITRLHFRNVLKIKHLKETTFVPYF